MNRRHLLAATPALFLSTRLSAHGVDELHVYPGVVRPVRGQPGVAIALFEIHAGKTPDRLTAASSPAAGAVSLVGRDGKVAAEIAIGAGEDLALRANGPHLRLTGIRGQLTPGREIPLRLTFARQGQLVGSVTVSKA